MHMWVGSQYCTRQQLQWQHQYSLSLPATSTTLYKRSLWCSFPASPTIHDTCVPICLEQSSCKSCCLSDWRYELLSSKYLAYSSVSSCNGSASSPQYTTCISPMMSSLDLPLLRLVIVAQSLQAFYEAQFFQLLVYFCRKVTDTSVSKCRKEGSIGRKLANTGNKWAMACWGPCWGACSGLRSLSESVNLRWAHAHRAAPYTGGRLRAGCGTRDD